MNDIKIKVCGLTSPEDAITCNALGVDYLGVVFERGLYQITPERAKEIRKAVPKSNFVGVFADADLDSVAEIAKFCGLSMIQLNGNEFPDYCERLLARTLLPIIKTFHQQMGSSIEVLMAYETSSFFLFDLERPSIETRGNGSIQKLWTEASHARRTGYRIFLAGGLDPSNVRKAVEVSSPYCVDVCHGVEKEPGVKDFVALEKFIKETK